MNNKPSTEERVWAVLSHLSAIALGVGLLLPVIGWSEQRRKSNYASFQCLQALGYQSLGYTFWLLSYLVLMIILLVGFVVVVGVAGVGSENLMGMGMGLALSLLLLSGIALYFLFPVIAAVSCALGKDYRYPIMGDRLARYLGYNSMVASDEPTWLIEDHGDRWVSAMGHVSVIIPVWGILAPAAAWILQGKRSLWLKFQSVQAVVYQLLVNLLYMGSGVVYLFGFIIFLLLTGFESRQTSPTGMIGLVALGVSLLIALLIVLIVPLLHILGQWAGYRVLKGDDYHYPIVGKLVEHWMAKP